MINWYNFELKMLDYMTPNYIRKTVHIPKNALLLVHGDFYHAGSAYHCSGEVLRYFTTFRHPMLNRHVKLEDPIEHTNGK